jgi:adenylate kinase
MEALHDKGEFEFAEEGETKKADILTKFKEYLEKQPTIVNMGEVNTDAAKKNAKKSANDQINELAEAKVKEDKISYSEALSLVQEENPELASQAYSEIESV